MKAGQSAAFAGVSGIGKTTISLLLARFYDVTGGRICIDGTDIRQLSLDSLRGAIGLVQQEVYIFNGTIRTTSATANGTRPRKKSRTRPEKRIFTTLLCLWKRDMTPR